MSVAAVPHVPVLLGEVLSALAVQPHETVIDGTFGAGGYSRAIVSFGARVIAIDRDPDAIREAKLVLDQAAGALRLVQGRFGDLDKISAAQGCISVDGVVLDIGVSSMQLDRADRGFSFSEDGPLDMRMDQSGETAADWLNRAEESEIADVLFRYGEERKSRRVARAIVAARPLSRTSELRNAVHRALGHHPGMPKDPATRSFQAIRIAVNDELGELERGLAAAERALRPGGRLAVVTFHSLEDRIVKLFFRTRSGAGTQGSRHVPDAPKQEGPKPTFTSVAKPVRAGEGGRGGRAPLPPPPPPSPPPQCTRPFRHSALGHAYLSPSLSSFSGRIALMMSAARKLQSIGLLALVTFCALLAYPVSLHVASTRSELQRVEREIADTRRRIRTTEGEIAVLANLSQLERWNADSFGYVAPTAGQYLSGERAIASVERLRAPIAAEDRAPIVLAMGPQGGSPGDEGDQTAIVSPADDQVAVTAARDIAQLMPTPTGAVDDPARQ
jgi:16S rRNA (cytosine1402-N4)-methyltransferase